MLWIQSSWVHCHQCSFLPIVTAAAGRKYGQSTFESSCFLVCSSEAKEEKVSSGIQQKSICLCKFTVDKEWIG
jgi:hypothetical protein